MTSLSISAICEAVEGLRQATVSGDKVSLDKWIAEELIYGHVSGRTQSKKEFIDDMASGRAVFYEISLSDQTIILIDNVAIIHHTFKGLRSDRRLRSNRIMSTWLLRNDQWKIVARQAVRI